MIRLQLELYSFPRNKLGSTKFILTNGYVLSRIQLMRGLGEWFVSLENFSRSFFALEIDTSAFACLCGLSLVSGNKNLFETSLPCSSLSNLSPESNLFFISVRHGLQNPVKVESLQNKIIESLRDHATYNSEAQKKAHYFSSILSKLPDLRSVNVTGLKFLNQIMLEERCSIPKAIEQLFSPDLLF